jgi:hypothetical protein
VRWREGGKQRSRTFDRKGDADTFDREVKRRLQLGPHLMRELDRNQQTLAAVRRRRLPQLRGTLMPKSRAHYQWALDHHLAELADEPLTALDVPRLNRHQRTCWTTAARRTPSAPRWRSSPASADRRRGRADHRQPRALHAQAAGAAAQRGAPVRARRGRGADRRLHRTRADHHRARRAAGSAPDRDPPRHVGRLQRRHLHDPRRPDQAQRRVDAHDRRRPRDRARAPRVAARVRRARRRPIVGPLSPRRRCASGPTSTSSPPPSASPAAPTSSRTRCATATPAPCTTPASPSPKPPSGWGTAPSSTSTPTRTRSRPSAGSATPTSTR